MKKRGFWRYILVEGIVLFGTPFFVIGTAFVWRHPDRVLSILLMFIGGLIGGFVLGSFSWKMDMRAYRKSKAQAAE